MTNPFVLAIRRDPAAFLGGLEVAELRAIAEGCVAALEKHAKAGDTTAPAALQAIYRKLGDVSV